MNYQKLLSTAIVLGGAVAFTALGSVTAEAKMKRISIGTNPAGTTYFVLGGLFAKIFQEKLGIRSTAQPHAGSSVYLPLLNKGELTMGLNSSLDSAMAYTGVKPYKAPTKKVRSLARIWQLPYVYFVRTNSGIKSLADLKGKRVVINLKSNVSLGQLNRTILATAGLKPSDVKEVTAGNIPQNINTVVEGRADAAVTALGIPLIRKANAGIPGGVTMLPIGPKATDAFMHAGMPGSRTMMTKPSKRNIGVTKPMKIAGFDTYVNVSGTLSADDAYTLVKTLHTNWKALQKQHPVLRSVKPNLMAPATNPIPYHPGAVKYYKEAGVWNAANDKHRSMAK
ncbi:MAG: TAXI family TRAP transporter solute-binding subunit [Rhodospirillaceae bacterium]|jgi:uncharacterized protein|nr:TAXI family TRAP transporter solute-binding subunit [Rhodospirillaceae bacterium]MBT7954710.1 TAXI family TRAP transporter solute-binding subunit [Rhodospirillaceae bacterium]